MPLDFDALIQDVSPESLKAAMKQGLAESGVSVDTREGSYMWGQATKNPTKKPMMTSDTLRERKVSSRIRFIPAKPSTD